MIFTLSRISASADQVAVVAVAVTPDRHIEIHLGVLVVGLRPPQIPGHPARAEARAGEPPGRAPAPRSSRRYPPSAASRCDWSVSRSSRSSTNFGNVSAHSAIRSSSPAGRSRLHAAGAVIVGVKPRAGGGFVELHQLLALLEPPKARRDRADIERVRRQVKQVVQDARDFGEHRADPLRAIRHLTPSSFSIAST